MLKGNIPLFLQPPNLGINSNYKSMLMILHQVKFYAKSGAEMLNWVIGTKTDMDLNMMSAHTANYWALILNYQSHMLFLSAQ